MLPATTLLAIVSPGVPVNAVRPEPVPAVQPAPAHAADSLSALPPEVRLRKLHLVRPDLIPYPIAYDVYC
jgi:hypothetical protein